MPNPQVQTNKVFNQLLKDESFWGLPESERIKVLAHVDTDFQSLNPNEQIKAMRSLRPGIQVKPRFETRTSLAREALRTGTGILGGLIGAFGTKSPGGSIIGTGLGAAAGDATYQLIQHATGDPYAPVSSWQAAKEIGFAGGREALYESVGYLPMRALGPAAKKLIPETQELIKYFKGRIKPIMFTPAEQTEAKTLDIMQNLAENAILGGKVKDFKLVRMQQMGDIADTMIASFGKRVTDEDAGLLFVQAVKGKWDAAKDAATIMYNTVGEMVPEGTMVNISNLKKAAEKISFIGKELSGMDAEKAGYNMADTILSMKDEISVDAATELRSTLLAKGREFQKIDKSAKVIGRSKRFARFMDQEIERTLTPHGEALKRWREANAFYNEKRELFNNVTLRRLIGIAREEGKGPEFIGENIFKPRAIRQIREVKAALGETSPEWKTLQSFYIQRLFKKSVDEETGDVIGKRIWNQIWGKTQSAMGEGINEIFSPSQIKELHNFTRALMIMQKKQGEGLGKMFIQLTQGGAIVGFASGFAAESAAVVLTPPILSRMITRPKMVKWLTKGLLVHPRQPEAMGIAFRLARFSQELYKEDLHEIKDMLPAKREQEFGQYVQESFGIK